MTNKQYEHFGRAIMIAAEIANKIEGVYHLRTMLEDELAKVMPRKEAVEIDKSLMSDAFPKHNLGYLIDRICENAAAEDKEKNGGKQ